MHVVNLAFEAGAFDAALMRSGTSSLVWHSARELAARGHRVSVVTPAHGRADHLRSVHGATDVEYHDSYVLPLSLDPAVWPGFPAETGVPLRTTALRMERDGVELYFLSNELLDRLPDTFYPDESAEGTDLSYFKTLAFQADGVRFIRAFFGAGADVVQAYEPVHHYVVPAALRAEPGCPVVSTVATNMPVNLKVYRPQVEAVLELLGAEADLDRCTDVPLAGDDLPGRVMRDHLEAVRASRRAGPGDVCVYALAVDHADAVDFMVEGQAETYTTFGGTPFEEYFRRLAVSRVIRENAHKFFVGGCAMSDSWFARDPAAVDRRAVLTSLGLDPDLPTFYHAARYSVEHKGQLELMRAVDEVLTAGGAANFLLRFSLGTAARPPEGSGDAFFSEIAARHPGRIHLDWRMVDEDTLFRHAAASDFCVFPGKYEQDTFLIAQGEAMACGAVPIATGQEVTRHFGQSFDPREPQATGFAVPRSFRTDDELLRAALVRRFEEAIGLFHGDRSEYRRLSGNARARARRFTWSRSGALREAAFLRLAEHGELARSVPVPLLIARGWYDLLDDAARAASRDLLVRTAVTTGAADVLLREAPDDPALLREAFRHAYDRARFADCATLARHLGDEDLAATVRERLAVRRGADSWTAEYRFPLAERVEMFLPRADGHLAVVAERAGHVFRATFPGPYQGTPLVLLLTLPYGRSAWDTVSPARVTPL